MDIFPLQFLYGPGAPSRRDKGGTAPAFNAVPDHVGKGNADAHNAAAQSTTTTFAHAARVVGATCGRS